jgi:hypothetical protein
VFDSGSANDLLALSVALRPSSATAGAIGTAFAALH